MRSSESGFAKRRRTLGKIKATQKILKVSFVIYADFESYTEKMSAENDHKKSITPYEKHVPYGFANLIICS